MIRSLSQRTAESLGFFPNTILTCFHHAGGSGSVFQNWARYFSSKMDVLAVTLPGRGLLYAHEPYLRIESAVDDLVEELAPFLRSQHAFFGHSLGAILAFEVARKMTLRGRGPTALIVSGHRAPQQGPNPAHPSLHQLHDEDLRDALRGFGGTPPQILDNEELLGVFMPALRADLRMAHAYRFATAPLLECPVLILGGRDDETAPPESLQRWTELTRNSSVLRTFPGGHFFLYDHEYIVCHEIMDFISNACGKK